MILRLGGLTMKAIKGLFILLLFFLVGCNDNHVPIIDIEGEITIPAEMEFNPVTGVTVFDVPVYYGDMTSPISMILTENLFVHQIYDSSISTSYYEVINDKGISLIPNSNYRYLYDANSNRIIASSNYFYLLDGEITEPQVAPYDFSYGYLCYDPENPNNELTPMYPENNERFAYAGQFYDNAAVVGIMVGDNLKFGVIDLEGNYLLNPVYDFIHTTITDNRVIVANGVVIYQFEDVSINDMNQVSYFSDEVGVYDLGLKTFVIPQTHSVISSLGNHQYFVYDSGDSSGKIMNLSNQVSISVTQGIVNLLPYNPLYYFGIAGYHIYVLEKETLKPVACFDRYRALLDYFGIVEVPNGYIYDYEEGDYAYNFNFVNPYPREYDFILNGGSFVVNQMDYLPAKEQMTFKLINHIGESVFEFPETVWVSEGYVIKDSYVPVIISNNGYGYYDTEGTMIELDYDYVSTITGGISIVGKRNEVTNQMVYYTYFQDNRQLKIIDFGVNTTNHTPIISEIVPGLYLLQISGEGFYQGYLINGYGDILLGKVEGIYQYSLKSISEDVSDIPIIEGYYQSVIGISPWENVPRKIISLTRSEAIDPSEYPLIRYPERIIGNGTIQPFVINFSQDSITHIYYQDNVVSSTAYSFDNSTKSLMFSDDYLAALGNGRHEFTLTSGTETVSIVIYGDDTPVTLHEYMYSEYPTIYYGNFFMEGTELFLHVEMVNIDSIDSITDLTINGVDCFSLMKSADYGTSYDNQPIYNFYLESDIEPYLVEGENIIRIGNSDRMIEYRIVYQK